jgi:hypothetical protein
MQEDHHGTSNQAIYAHARLRQGYSKARECSGAMDSWRGRHAFLCQTPRVLTSVQRRKLQPLRTYHRTTLLDGSMHKTTKPLLFFSNYMTINSSHQHLGIFFELLDCGRVGIHMCVIPHLLRHNKESIALHDFYLHDVPGVIHVGK